MVKKVLDVSYQIRLSDSKAESRWAIVVTSEDVVNEAVVLDVLQRNEFLRPCEAIEIVSWAEMPDLAEPIQSLVNSFEVNSVLTRPIFQ